MSRPYSDRNPSACRRWDLKKAHRTSAASKCRRGSSAAKAAVKEPPGQTWPQPLMRCSATSVLFVQFFQSVKTTLPPYKLRITGGGLHPLAATQNSTDCSTDQ